MIFYGTNSSRLKNGRLSNVNCPNCDTQTAMNYSVFGKYAYIYWIPIFPLGKENILECNHCKRTYKLSELPQQIKQKFELEKHTGIPFQHFAGLAIIGLIIAWFTYSNSKDKENTALYIQEPLANDVYIAKGETAGYYTTAKVTEVTTDSLYVIFNEYEYSKRNTSKIEKDENYSIENIEGYTKDEIISLHVEGYIVEVKRD